MDRTGNGGTAPGREIGISEAETSRLPAAAAAAVTEIARTGTEKTGATVTETEGGHDRGTVPTAPPAAAVATTTMTRPRNRAAAAALSRPRRLRQAW